MPFPSKTHHAEAEKARQYAELAAELMEEYRYDEALPLCEQALKLREQRFHDARPETAESLYQMGSILFGKGDMPKAIRFFRRALQIQERLLGKHLDTALTLHALGQVCYQNPEEALGYFQKAFAIRSALLGNRHPLTKDSARRIALFGTRTRSHR
jgi:tetratricopeptide (TPR) repeat protein